MLCIRKRLTVRLGAAHRLALEEQRDAWPLRSGIQICRFRVRDGDQAAAAELRAYPGRA